MVIWTLASLWNSVLKTKRVACLLSWNWGDWGNEWEVSGFPGSRSKRRKRPWPREFFWNLRSVWKQRRTTGFSTPTPRETWVFKVYHRSLLLPLWGGVDTAWAGAYLRVSSWSWLPGTGPAHDCSASLTHSYRLGFHAQTLCQGGYSLSAPLQTRGFDKGTKRHSRQGHHRLFLTSSHNILLNGCLLY